MISPRTTSPVSRRGFLRGSTAAALLAATPALATASKGSPKSSTAGVETAYPVGVCDWMILKRQKLGAFSRTAEIGADGLELDMGGLGNRPTFDSKLMDPVERRRFLDAADEYGLKICSIAMSGFYAQDFATREVGPMVRDTINTMCLMNVGVAFLPLGVQGDLLKYPQKRPAIVERLKWAGEMAASADVVIGIETAYDAAAEAELLEDIGSPSVRSYFNFANALQNGRDLHAELKTLGAKRICQIHATDEDGVWLQDNPRIDMPAVKKTLSDMGWRGWLVLERSRKADRARDAVGNFRENTRFLKSIFQ